MAEQLVAVDGGELCFETFGDPTHPAVVLLGGMGASMDWWPVELCERLAAGDRFVVRYDHRDTGRSSISPIGQPAYDAEVLATDPLRVLDALGVERAHLVGVSMGGGISQQLAAQHAERVRTITLIATSPAGARLDPTPLPPPVPRILASFEAAPPAGDDAAAMTEHLVAGERTYGGTLTVDEDRVRRIAERVVQRSHDVAAGLTNHALADDSSSVPFAMADIGVPTLVLHGTDDPLFPLAHGEALAAEIPGASLVALEGMGHQVPPPELWDLVVPAILRHTA